MYLRSAPRAALTTTRLFARNAATSYMLSIAPHLLRGGADDNVIVDRVPDSSGQHCVRYSSDTVCRSEMGAGRWMFKASEPPPDGSRSSPCPVLHMDDGAPVRLMSPNGRLARPRAREAGPILLLLAGGLCRADLSVRPAADPPAASKPIAPYGADLATPARPAAMPSAIILGEFRRRFVELAIASRGSSDALAVSLATAAPIAVTATLPNTGT